MTIIEAIIERQPSNSSTWESNTAPSLSGEGVDPVFARGIENNIFRYKYLLKVHIQLASILFVVMGSMFVCIIWKPLLAITLPVAAIGINDLSHSYIIGDELARPEEEGGIPVQGLHVAAMREEVGLGYVSFRAPTASIV